LHFERESESNEPESHPTAKIFPSSAFAVQKLLDSLMMVSTQNMHCKE